MSAVAFERSLDEVCEQLAAGSQALLAMTWPPDNWCDPLCKAAGLLKGLDLSGMSVSRRKEVEERMCRLQMNSAAAGKLLESAAALYFGRVLSRGAFDCGYLADGNPVSAGGGCFKIDG